MASLKDVTDGELTEFKRQLSAAGFTAELLREMIRHPNEACCLVDHLLDPEHRELELINGMFVSPEQQIANVMKWNARYKWGIPDEEFTRALEAPAWPFCSDQPLQALVLVPCFETTARTVQNLAQAVISTQRAARRWDNCTLNSLWLWSRRSCEPVLPEEKLLYKPRLRWQAIAFGAGVNQRLDKNNPGPMGWPSAGVLAAAAHFPVWVRRMDGNKVPFVWIPGYRHINWASLASSSRQKRDFLTAEKIGDVSVPQLRWEHPGIVLGHGYGFERELIASTAIPRYIESAGERRRT